MTSTATANPAAATSGRTAVISLGRRHGTRTALLTLGLALVASYAVVPSGPRAFALDGSLRITAPAPLAQVTLPFTVSWKAPAGEYAVFVDGPPVGVGSSVRLLGGRDCYRNKACRQPADKLEQMGVYLSSNGSVQIQSLSVLTNLGSHQAYPVHVITVIPLGANRDRRGSASWQVEVHAKEAQS